MLRGLLKLTWLEIKIFVREPLGLIGVVLLPVALFLIVGRAVGPRLSVAESPRVTAADVTIAMSLLVAISTVLSLIAIISIYREGGILKRLRATPLRSHTILIAHVLAKLFFTALTLTLMFVAGRRYFVADAGVAMFSFTLAILFSTICILSVGFVLASLVPTARFAQPLGTFVLYPLLAVSGLFIPVGALPPVLRWVAAVSPFTHAVSLLRGIWNGEGWSAHLVEVGFLMLFFAVCTAISSRVFRWE